MFLNAGSEKKSSLVVYDWFLFFKCLNDMNFSTDVSMLLNRRILIDKKDYIKFV